MFWLMLACHRLEKIDPLADNRACGDPIVDPVAGYSTEKPALATAHAESYGASPSPRHVHMSWSSDPSSSQAILWQTDADTLATMVEYATAGTDPEFALGGSFLASATPEDGRLHEVHLCGLKPGTRYTYRVGGEGAWSPEYSFTTAPEPGSSASFKVGIAGDARDNQSTWGQLLSQMESHDPAFYLFSGDLVDLGVNMVEWEAWFDALGGVGEYKPFMTVHGNHEFLTRQYFGFFSLPGNEQWYSFDYGQMHIVGLNDTVAQATDLDTQATWMDQDLQETEAPLKVVFHHKPAYTSCNTHPPDPLLQEKWAPVEERNGVVLDFSGHNHNYERSYPLNGGVETTPELGTTYIVSAGAGANLYDNDLGQSYTAGAAVTYHYVILEVDGGTVTTTAYDLAGNVLDTFTTSR